MEKKEKVEIRLTQRQIRALETKEKIYNAGIQVINDKGYLNVSIEDITNKANVAKGSFYTYFNSKEALIHYTFIQSDNTYKSVYESMNKKNFRTDLLNFLDLSYKENEKRGKGVINAIISNYFVFPESNVYSEDRALLICLGKIVDSGFEEGSIKKYADRKELINMIVSCLVGIEVMWCFREDNKKLSELVSESIGVLVDGILR